MEDKYKYRYRPGYHSKEWLIEIIHGEEFDYDIFLDAIRELSPLIIEKKLDFGDLTYFIKIKTSIGTIDLEKDFWDIVFIDSDDNICLNKIDAILENDSRFIKEDVDIEEYK
jgi:hypothetical protein